MPIEVLMPALSPTMSEGNLARWLKKEGDQVAPGDVIAEIETDKATMEVEAVDEGTLGRIVVAEGTEGVAVNSVIAYLLEEGEDASSLEGAAAGEAVDQKGGDGGTAPHETKAERPPPEPAPEPPAEEAPSPAEARPGEPAGRPVAEMKAHAGRGGNGAERPEGRIFASPLAKRMAAQAGIDLGALRGSGPHGRIIKVDVERAMREGVPERRPAAPEEKRPAAEAPRAAPPAAAEAPVTPPTPAAQPLGPHTEVKLSTMRKVIARRLVEAKQQVPHFYLTVDCEIDALLGLRRELNEREGADYKLSVNDFVIKASALALRRIPEANASWGGDRIFQYQDVDIAVAVALEGGLITPVIRRADQKGLAAISSEMKELAGRAREGKLKPEEYQGGTFSVSNLGMYDVREFAAIINPPQSCILAVGAGEQ
ncbi:MAG TPA: pyruvate dehydrogenase complex dihydrolipoamide acetyltransferase, partial [Geminicoccaceae bacterium]|nr:pyruvate dehydrogenase complex dihydrolipoamide acetyltransferase [Geminicoccaceae bacterium]